MRDVFFDVEKRERAKIHGENRICLFDVFRTNIGLPGRLKGVGGDLLTLVVRVKMCTIPTRAEK